MPRGTQRTARGLFARSGWTRSGSGPGVSNAEFAAFVSKTGYVTEAEKFGWSFVFAWGSSCSGSSC